MELELVLITGMSGSGKSVALHAVEDAGYYSVDNLPPELLLSFVKLQQERSNKRVAIAMDVRSAQSLPQVPELLRALADLGVVIKSLFLDSTTDTLVRRYSESRRKHPLSQTDGLDATNDQHRALVEAIELERELLADLCDHAHVIDTNLIRPIADRHQGWPPDAGVRIVCIQAWHPRRRRLRIRCADVAQSALRTRTQGPDRQG